MSDPAPEAGQGDSESHSTTPARVFTGPVRLYLLARFSGSAAFQIAIVLASSYLITGVIYLLWGAAGLGVIGLLFTAFGIFVPNALHLLGVH